MFWQKKEVPQPKSHGQILKSYLSCSMPLVVGKCSDPHVKACVRVFVLGMADMIRQVEQLDHAQFISAYAEALSANNLLPSKGAGEFVKSVGAIAPKNESVAKIIRYGAQSIRMFVVERDPEAPTDLLSVVVFAEKNSSSFNELVCA